MSEESQSEQASDLYALLIGIDCYLPNQLPDGTYYKSLRGCVRDISQVEEYLKRTLGLPEEQILKLTATNTGASEPEEPEEEWPTYENMVAAFKEITKKAPSGSRVYVHYSGHGGRAPTILKERKGENGTDEALVPTDIGKTEARYLRDVELAKLLKAMVDKGLTVAAVLDSCHSGGMTRGRGDVAVRGLSSVDTTETRPTESLVGTQEELEALWVDLTEGGTRDATLGSGWLPEPKDYTLLAACRRNESAYEYAFDGENRNGALTYWLLDSLQDIGPGLNYKVLHDRIVAKVHSQFESQTPQLQGEGDRSVFGSDRVQPHYRVNVLKVEEARKRVLLNAGQTQMLRKGAQFVIYPHGSTDFSDLEKRLASVELSDVGATESWAKIIEKFTEDEIEQGAQAALLGAPSIGLVHNVSLVQQEDLDPTIEQEAALQAVQQAMPETGWVEITTDTEKIEYQVVVTNDGQYEIWDRAGQAIKNLQPPIAIDEPDAAKLVVRRLEHLSKYHALRQLRNHDQFSPLARKLEVELIGKREEYDPADPFEPEQPFDEPGGTPAVSEGEWFGLRIKNASTRDLNVTIFDLMPGWGAKQLYPAGPGDAFVTFLAGQEVVLPIRASLPQKLNEGTDVIKVFATAGTTNFRWLELPKLDESLRGRVGERKLTNPLDELLDAMAADEPKTRDLTVAAYPSQEWVTEQVEIRTARD